MWSLTIKGIVARKWRVLLSAVAITLGVAFVSGTMVLGDTLNRSFNGYLGEAFESIDVVVKGPGVDDGGSETVPADLVSRIKRVDGVAEAEAGVSGFARVVPSEGGKDVAVTSGSATSWIQSDQLNPLTIVDGRPPRRSGEVVIDPDTAETLGVQIGDPVRVVSLRPAVESRVVGLARMGDQDSGLSVTALDLDTAQQLLARPGQYSGVRVAAADGVSADELRDRIADAVGERYVVQTGMQATDELADEVGQATGTFTGFLGVFGVIALLIAAFLIVNTFAMMATQRSRELAVLRAVGASAAQVRRSVVWEGVSVGAVAGALGLLGGIGVAALLRTIFEAVGVDLPSGQLAVSPLTLAVGLLAGPLVTAVAAYMPARRASRVAPVVAMRGDDARVDRSSRPRTLIGLGIAALAAAVGAAGLARDSAAQVTAAAVVLVVALLVTGPLLVTPSIRVLSWPIRTRGRVPSLLAVENLTRVRRRTAATSAALAVGVALVAGASVTIASMGAANGATAEELLDAEHVDAVVSSDLALPFSTDAEKVVKSVDGVDNVVGVRYAEGRLLTGPDQENDPGSVQVGGVDTAALATTLTLQRVAGNVDSLPAGQILVADSTGWHVGDKVGLRVGGTDTGPVTVAGVYRANDVVAPYLTTAATFDTWTADAVDSLLLVQLADADSEEVMASLLDALEQFPLLHAQSRSDYTEAQVSNAETFINVITALLGMSLLVAMLGVANTMGLSIVERIREVGLLRAVGMSRRQLRRMIRVEAVLTALHGALLGIIVGGLSGVGIAAAVLHDSTNEVVIPVSRLALTALGLIIIAVLSAALPARRATRLDILDALRTT